MRDVGFEDELGQDACRLLRLGVEAPRFVAHLVALLRRSGFPNLAWAVCESHAQGPVAFEESAALIELGIEVMSRDSRPFAGALADGDDLPPLPPPVPPSWQHVVP
jgi:hypothetical protein